MYNYYAHDLAIQVFGIMFLCSSQETPCPSQQEEIELLILLIICPSGCRKKVKWTARRTNLFKIDVEL